MVGKEEKGFASFRFKAAEISRKYWCQQQSKTKRIWETNFNFTGLQPLPYLETRGHSQLQSRDSHGKCGTGGQFLRDINSWEVPELSWTWTLLLPLICGWESCLLTLFNSLQGRVSSFSTKFNTISYIIITTNGFLFEHLLYYKHWIALPV